MRYFGVDEVACCGRTMRVYHIMATLVHFGVNHSVWHVAKRCRGACGSTWNLNKRTFGGTYGDQQQPCVWHEFYPFTGGRVPKYFANKSGKTIFSADFITACVIQQCSMRAGYGWHDETHWGCPHGMCKRRRRPEARTRCR
ncbi:unnamed protein product [Pylaiella littoralis]